MRTAQGTVLIWLSFVLCVCGQEKTDARDSDPQTVDYCAVRENPDLYNQKMIRIHGIYRHGFEVSAFYSKACFDDAYYARRETWVDNFYRAHLGSDLNTSAIVKTFLSGKAGDELEVTLTGVFRGSKEGGAFGHMAGYNFQLDVSSIEEAMLLPNEIFGCRRIDRTKPFHYLSLEKIEKGISPRFEGSEQLKSEKLIYIRLSNNSTCPISIPTLDTPDSREGRDQREMPVTYTLESPCSRVSWRPVTKLKQTLSVLPPGNSLYFAVPLRFLTTEPFDIRIPFDGQKERAGAHYQPFHFSRYDIPEKLRKDLDCTKYK